MLGTKRVLPAQRTTQRTTVRVIIVLSMSEGEFLVWMAVVAFLAVSGLVRAIAALFSPATRQSVARHRVAHTCWFVGSAVALLLLLRLLFPTRELIRLSSAGNHPAAGKAGIALCFDFGHHFPGLPEPGRSARKAIRCEYGQ